VENDEPRTSLATALLIAHRSAFDAFVPDAGRIADDLLACAAETRRAFASATSCSMPSASARCAVYSAFSSTSVPDGLYRN
jgi:hypothetical protein